MSEARLRYPFIDLLRFVAAFFMIQGHVFDAVLSPVVKAHPQYYLHDFFHGFVAPAFLFASGVAYSVSTLRRWDEHAVWGQRAARRVRRFLGLIGVGYALHLPFFSLRKTLSTASPEQVKSLLQSDVLQCVGVTLLALQLGVLLARKQSVFLWGVAAAATLAILISPLTWAAHLTGALPMAVASYISSETGSWFPLFPWAAYLLFGVVYGGAFIARAKTEGQVASVMIRGGLVHLMILFAAWGAMYLPWTIYPPHDFWKANPLMFLVRLSAVSIAATGVFLATHLWKNFPRIPSIMGRESLFIYIVHLVIVYGSVVNRGMSQRIGPSFSIAQSLAAFAAVFAATAAITLLWNKLKTDNHVLASSLAAAGAGTFLAAFALRPW